MSSCQLHFLSSIFFNRSDSLFDGKKINLALHKGRDFNIPAVPPYLYGQKTVPLISYYDARNKLLHILTFLCLLTKRRVHDALRTKISPALDLYSGHIRYYSPSPYKSAISFIQEIRLAFVKYKCQ